MGSVKNAAMIALAHHLIHHPRKADGVRFAIKSTDCRPGWRLADSRARSFLSQYEYGVRNLIVEA
jgi:hypothetical protein